jgi:SAM-dependent methyltransferase
MTDPLAAKYQGEVGTQYFQTRFASADAPAVLGRLNAAKFAPFVGPSDHVLDYGAGTGDLLANLNCARKVGVEINEAAVSLCRKNHPEIEIANSLDLVGGPFNVVITHHCLEHLAEPFKALRAILRAVRPGGMLIACVPIDDWRLTRNQRWLASDRVRHLYTWTPLAFGHLLTEAGFVVRDVRINCFSTPGRYAVLLDRTLPAWAIKGVCRLTSIVKRRRELIAVCTAPS